MRKTNSMPILLSKYILITCILLFMFLVYRHAGSTTKRFEDTRTDFCRELDLKSLSDSGPQGLKRYYGLNAEDYAGILLYTAKTSMSAEEILLIQVKDSTQLNEIERAISKRLENRKKDFGNYAPEQTALLKQAQFTIKGTYIFMAVSEHAEDYKAAFTKSLF